MTNFYKKCLVVALACISNFGFGQSNEIKIKFIGNCGLYMTDGISNFYIDFPYKSGAHNYMEYDQSEIDNVKENAVFIFTHRHADHYSKKLLKKLSGQKFDPWNIDELEKLGQSIPNFNIKAFRTKHNVFGISFRHYSYLITWHSKKIYLSGDTENADTIATQKDIDWAFIPVWLALDAKEKGIKLGSLSKMYAIYHIGPNDKITNDSNDPIINLLDKQGEVITIPYLILQSTLAQPLRVFRSLFFYFSGVIILADVTDSTPARWTAKTSQTLIPSRAVSKNTIFEC